jgi:hypothetical protein
MGGWRPDSIMTCSRCSCSHPGVAGRRRRGGRVRRFHVWGRGCWGGRAGDRVGLPGPVLATTTQQALVSQPPLYGGGEAVVLCCEYAVCNHVDKGRAVRITGGQTRASAACAQVLTWHACWLHGQATRYGLVCKTTTSTRVVGAAKIGRAGDGNSARLKSCAQPRTGEGEGGDRGASAHAAPGRTGTGLHGHQRTHPKVSQHPQGAPKQ